MFNKKKLLKKAVTLGVLVSTMFCTPVIAADKDEEVVDAENGIVKTVTETENGTTIEGVVSGMLRCVPIIQLTAIMEVQFN